MKKLCIILLLLCTQVANSFPTVTEINPAIYSLMQQVDIDSLEAKIRYQQNLNTRPRIKSHPAYPSNVAAQNWLHQKYENFGNINVYYNHFLPDSLCAPAVIKDHMGQTYTIFLEMAENVLAVQTGTVYSDEFIIVSAHFDTPPFDNMPGADCNATGTAGVLEIARVLSPHTFKRSIIYVNFNGEEMPPIRRWGSFIFAHYCRENDISILGVFNLDMLGYFPLGEPLEIFYNDRPLINKEFAKYFGKVANLYLPNIPAKPNQDKDTNRGKKGMGDCISFIHYNYPAMYIGDVVGVTGFGCNKLNVWMHSPADTIGIGKADAGVNSMELVRAYTQATLAAIAELAELDDTHVEENNFVDCTISPNPTNSTATVTLYLKDIGNLTVTLHNPLGQEIMELHSGFTDTKIFTKTFSLEALAKGMYYLKIVHNGNVRVEKIIKN